MGRKITALTELDGLTAQDWIPVVDTSDTTSSPQGTTKKALMSQLAALSPLIELTAQVTNALHILTFDLAYTDVNALLFTIPANCFVMFAFVVVDTVWDVAPAFTVGTATDADALVMNHEHKLNDLAPSFVVHPYHALAETSFYTTWDHNGATAGAGELIIFYFQRD